jgi:diacylglycerol kinase family enzyme
MDRLNSGASRVLILANPRAGTWNSRELVHELVGALGRRGIDAAAFWDRGAFSAGLRASPPEEVRCVVAAGGDGTLVEVVNRAPGLPVAVLPVGNENLLARHWHIQRSAVQLARLIAEGHVRELDLARLGDRSFCLVAGAGFDADVVERVHRRRSGHVHYLTYLGPVCNALLRYRFPALEAEVVETGERIPGTAAFVFNFPQYALGLRIAPKASASDGLLDLCVLEKGGVGHLLRYLAAVYRGRQASLPDFRHRQVRQVRLRSAGRVPLQADGDPEGHLPATVSVVPGALRLVVPGGR